MRKIKMLNRISIDGYFASLNEATFGMDWFVLDPEVDLAVRAISGHMDTMIVGKTTFTGFERSWVPILHDPNASTQMKAVAEELTQMTKIVFSSNMKETTWENTRIYAGNLVNEVHKLIAEPGTDILVMGSGTIVQQLADEGLIDEYIFILTPVIAGGGKPLFQHVQLLNLNLKEAITFESGNVVLHYEFSRNS